MQKWRKAQYDLEQARKAVGQLQKEIGAKMKVRALSVGSRCVPPDGFITLSAKRTSTGDVVTLVAELLALGFKRAASVLLAGSGRLPGHGAAE